MSNIEGWTEDFRQRFSKLVEQTGGREAAARVVGYSPDQLTNWKNGKSTPPLFRVAKLCKINNTTLDWLLTGSSSAENFVDPAKLRSAVNLLSQLMHNEGAGQETLHPLGLEEIRLDPFFNQVIDWYHRTEGKISSDDRFTDTITSLSIIHTLPESGLPLYRYCGAGSMAAIYYGGEFAKDPERNRKSTDEDLEARSAQEYRIVLREKAPRCSWVATRVHIFGEDRFFRYNRIVLPIDLGDQPSVMVLARETHPPKRFA